MQNKSINQFNRKEHNFNRSVEQITRIIAKIEQPEFLEYLDAIIQVADGLMVVRNDLFLEMGLAGY